jgi:hypothetical protein
MKLLYKPFAIIAGLVASRAAGAIFRRLWTFLSKETEMPQALEQSRGWTKVVVAAMLKGAVFGGVKALVDRTSQRATSVEPASGRGRPVSLRTRP